MCLSIQLFLCSHLLHLAFYSHFFLQDNLKIKIVLKCLRSFKLRSGQTYLVYHMFTHFANIQSGPTLKEEKKPYKLRRTKGKRNKNTDQFEALKISIKQNRPKPNHDCTVVTHSVLGPLTQVRNK